MLQQARARYRSAAAAEMPDLDDPHEIILATLTELERALGVLRSAAEQGREGPDVSLQRALTAVYILQSSLDFDKGGEIAVNLFRVYEFVREQVMRSFRREAPAEVATGLRQSATHLAGIREAWQGIAPGRAEAR